MGVLQAGFAEAHDGESGVESLAQCHLAAAPATPSTVDATSRFVPPREDIWIGLSPEAVYQVSRAVPVTDTRSISAWRSGVQWPSFSRSSPAVGPGAWTADDANDPGLRCAGDRAELCV
jgi:hypothetical protein